MNTAIRHFARNSTGGRDLIVGDIHGCFSRLHAALMAVGFDGFKDRLFSVGDLVDRGPESPQALTWLRQPWFHAIRGNHEEAAVVFAAGAMPAQQYVGAFGGGWNVDNPQAERERIAELFADLPIGIELETATGLVGILHADCPVADWRDLAARLAGDGLSAQAAADCCVWSRDRIALDNNNNVAGVRAVVVGHTPVDRITSLGNVIYIDTQGWQRGHFTLLDAETLQPVNTGPATALDWGDA